MKTNLHTQILLMAVVLYMPLTTAIAVDDTRVEDFLHESEGEFNAIFEPSGITQLANGQMLLVADEQDNSLHEVTFIENSGSFTVPNEFPLKSIPTIFGKLLGHSFDDLEGVANDGAGFVYAIGSHNNLSARKKYNRRKLIRFRVKNRQISELSVVTDLQKHVMSNFPALKKAVQRNKKSRSVGINIEAIAFERQKGQLLIALRSPLIDGRAVVLTLENPDTYLSGHSAPSFETEPTLLDLDNGGIRAMTFDDQSRQFLLISRRDDRKSKFKLWQYSAEPGSLPKRIRTDISLDSVEGISQITSAVGVESGFIFVQDNGSRLNRRGGGWFILSRTTLGLNAGKFQ